MKSTDGMCAAKTLLIVDVWAHFIGEDSLGILESSVGERDESLYCFCLKLGLGLVFTFQKGYNPPNSNTQLIWDPPS